MGIKYRYKYEGGIEYQILSLFYIYILLAPVCLSLNGPQLEGIALRL